MLLVYRFAYGAHARKHGFTAPATGIRHPH
jgi:hypothetical protein